MDPFNKIRFSCLSGVIMKRLLYEALLIFERAMLIALISTSASGCASAEIDFEEIIVTKLGIVFPGLPKSVQRDELTELPEEALAELGFLRKGEDFALPAQQFNFADAIERLPKGIDAMMYVSEVVVKAHRQNQKLSFMNGLKLTVSEPNVKKGKSRVVFEYEATTHSGGMKDATIRGPVSASAASFDSSELAGQIYELTVWCDPTKLPRESWGLDVSLTFSGNVDLDY